MSFEKNENKPNRVRGWAMQKFTDRQQANKLSVK